jgi:hypothetical protein
VEPSSLYDHLALDLSGYDTVDLNPVDDAVMHSNDGVADHPLSSSLSSPSRQLPDNGGGNGGDTSKPTTLGRTSRKGRTLRPLKDTITSAPPKKRLRKSSSTNPQSAGSSTASRPSPVPPPQPPPEVYYPHLATPQPQSLLTDTTILQRRRARWKQLADAEGDPIPPTEICGLPVPKKRHDACAACGMTEEDDGNTILLCDGPKYVEQCNKAIICFVSESIGTENNIQPSVKFTISRYLFLCYLCVGWVHQLWPRISHELLHPTGSKNPNRQVLLL